MGEPISYVRGTSALPQMRAITTLDSELLSDFKGGPVSIIPDCEEFDLSSGCYCLIFFPAS